jgi:vacuolar-type H+-ATPase subunit I/STV1
MGSAGSVLMKTSMKNRKDKKTMSSSPSNRSGDINTLQTIDEQYEEDMDEESNKSNVAKNTNKYESLMQRQKQVHQTIHYMKRKLSHLQENVDKLQVAALKNNLQEKVMSRTITQIVVNTKIIVDNICAFEEAVKKSIQEVASINMEHIINDGSETSRMRYFSYHSTTQSTRDFEKLKKTILDIQPHLDEFDSNFNFLIGEVDEMSKLVLCENNRNWGDRILPPAAQDHSLFVLPRPKRRSGGSVKRMVIGY